MINQLKRSGHSVAMLCCLFSVSQSGYYSAQSRPPSPRNQRRKELNKQVVELFEAHQKRYGRPRLYRQLKSQNVLVSEKTIYSIMKQHRLKARKKTGYLPKTTLSDVSRALYPYLLKANPTTSPNQVIVTDITYVSTGEGWLYLSAIMDLHSKAIKGYYAHALLDVQGPLKALHQAMKRYPQLRGAIHHSDRGCQYTSSRYQKALAQYQLRCSMSAQGYCYDNAAMESFWATLKTEAFPETGVFPTKEQARQAIFEYIEAYYNSVRLHSSLHYLTPLAVELLTPL